MGSQFVELKRLMSSRQQQSGKVVSSTSSDVAVATPSGLVSVRNDGASYAVGQSVVVSGGAISSARRIPEEGLPVFIL